MPTTKANQAAEDLREEFETLRKEVSDMMELLKDKGSSYAEEMGGKMEEKLEAYQEKARQGAEAAYETGSEGVEEIGNRVRENPLLSLGIAFGVGYVISKLMDQGK